MISELTALIKKWREMATGHDARYVLPSGTVIRQCADDLEELVEANSTPTTADMCPNCERSSCKHYRGGRSEASYIDCIAHTAELAQSLRRAVHRAGAEDAWPAVWTWMDLHKDAIVKKLADENGAFERENAVLKSQLATTERDLKRAVDENTDETAKRVAAEKRVKELEEENAQLVMGVNS